MIYDYSLLLSFILPFGLLMTHWLETEPGIEENALYKLDSVVNPQQIESIFNKYESRFRTVEPSGWKGVLLEQLDQFGLHHYSRYHMIH